ncbi:MAG: hypothetical protein J6Q89_04935 [Clostridia bacterium]|nr:hypothetical protein [Clostridia bacterium]
MQKRAFKFNILDLVIFVVIICSVAVLFFHDTITELFEEATMVTLEVTAVIEGEENVNYVLDAKNKTVVLKPRLDSEIAFEMTVAHSRILPGSVTVPNKVETTLSCIGYEKFGRYYTESGDRIYNNSVCTVIIDGNEIEGNVILVAEKDL